MLTIVVLNKTLSISKFLLRAFFGGPVTKPFMLKVSSNTGLVITLLVVFFLDESISVNSNTVVLTTFTNSVVSVNFILLITGGIRGVSVLIVDNIVVNCVYSTVASFIIAFTSSSGVIGLRG